MLGQAQTLRLVLAMRHVSRVVSAYLRMKGLLPSAQRAFAAVPARARWSFADQALISGVNVFTSIVLVRALGLHEFGVFSVVLIGLGFASSLQWAVIVAPMMSLFDQRGRVSQSGYLATILLHQGLLCALSVAALATAAIFTSLSPAMPVDFGLAVLVLVTFQFQELSRRFFYVTDRPALALMSDVVAYGGRFAVVVSLALLDSLTINGVWITIAGASAAALVFLGPDVIRCAAQWWEIVEVTRRHLKMIGWLIGNTIVGWFSATDFPLLMVGAALGPAQLGAARAVQSLIHIANLLLQALENFVPSDATRSLQEGGPRALLRYVTYVSALGAAAIGAMTVVLILLADVILNLMYGRTFPDQLAILAILGGCAALLHVSTIVFAGLRSLEFMRPAFFIQAAITALLLALAWPIATNFGVTGALAGVLVARLALTVCWSLLLKARVTTLEGARP